MTELSDRLLEEKKKVEASLTALVKYWQDMPGSEEQHDYLIWKRARIDAAFAREQAGKLGICLLCDQSIPYGRLKRIPYVEYCLPCQRNLESLLQDFEKMNLRKNEWEWVP